MRYLAPSQLVHNTSVKIFSYQRRRHVSLQEWECSSCTMTNQKKKHMHIYTNNIVLTSKSWSCRLMGSEKTKKEKRERKGGKCTTVMTTQICFDSFWPTELSKKHLMLKWGQEKVKKRYMSAVMNISTADLKILAVVHEGGGSCHILFSFLPLSSTCPHNHRILASVLGGYEYPPQHTDVSVA